MSTSSQGKKIVVASVAIFLVSFSMLLFFLKDFTPHSENVHTDVLKTSHSENSSEELIDTEEMPEYLKHIQKDEPAVPLFVTNSEGEIEYGNEEFCKIVDNSCENIKGDVIFDYVSTKDISDLAAIHGKLVHDGEKIDGLGPFRMLKGKTEVFLLFTAEPLIDDDDKVSHIIYRIKDITHKVTELNENVEKVEDAVLSEDSDSEKWIETLYPKVDELKEDAEKLVAQRNS